MENVNENIMPIKKRLVFLARRSGIIPIQLSFACISIYQT